MTFVNQSLQERKHQIYQRRYFVLASNIDKLFAILLGFQWALAVVLANANSALTWVGDQSQTSLHIYAAIILGGILTSLPVFFVLKYPGAIANRYMIAVAQMGYSILLIHVTNGRIETHFHVFVSLAFLAMYRDWRPLLLATVITALDHFFRGFYWPQSIYGTATVVPWRAIEHTAWVLFEDIVLIYSIRLATGELDSIAEAQAKLEEKRLDLENANRQIEALNEKLEAKVIERTAQLQDSQVTILNQQQSLIASAKMSALGEMAGGVAHEINTPLSIIGLQVELLEESLATSQIHAANLTEGLATIGRTVERVAKIVSGLKNFARDGSKSLPADTKIVDLIDDTLSFCKEKFSNHGIRLDVRFNDASKALTVECQSVEISQVILNLLNNSYDAIESMQTKWISIEVSDRGEMVELAVIDSGSGIPVEIQNKLMQPFFTTKELGKGTGLGLSISRGIIDSHKGQLYIDDKFQHTKFVVRLPKRYQGRLSQSA